MVLFLFGEVEGRSGLLTKNEGVSIFGALKWNIEKTVEVRIENEQKNL
jgi:hypothetical protein